MLVAVPLAATIGVLAGYAIRKYKKSTLYMPEEMQLAHLPNPPAADYRDRPVTAAGPDQARQLTFDLGHRQALGRDDFLVTPSNSDAVAWIDLWPEWPASCLILQGPAASGKSHLAAVWGQRSQAVAIPPASLGTSNPRALFALGRALTIDGLDPWIGDCEAETALFHLYNMMREHDRSLLITLRAAPIRQTFAVADLASRLRASPSVLIQPPDDTLLAAILVKMFADRQLAVGDDVIRYILPRMERTFAAARQLVEAADDAALRDQRGITVATIKPILNMPEPA